MPRLLNSKKQKMMMALILWVKFQQCWVLIIYKYLNKQLNNNKSNLISKIKIKNKLKMISKLKDKNKNKI